MRKKDVRDKALGAAVSIFRHERKLSQAQVAEAMVRRNHRWHPSTVSMVERGQRRLRMAEANALAHSLGTTVPNLLRRADLTRLEP